MRGKASVSCYELFILAEEPRFERGQANMSLGPKPSVLPITLFLNKMVLPEGIEPSPFLAMERSTY